MGDLLTQALKITIVGMGMTFASIGALIGGMYLLTGLATDRPGGEAMKRRSSTASERGETPGREVAAVAAVSAAVADAATAEEEEAGPRDPRHIAAAAAVAAAMADTAAQVSAAPQTSVDVWTLHVRSQQLAQRAHYNALRANRSNS
jgi:Na+-transporting methylmalonyl-CoA/oxaloacetate decarboxylase gamma subunit